MEVKLGSLTLTDVAVDLRIDFRLSRTMEQGAKGDDMFVEGRKSREYVINGKMDPARFNELIKIVQETDDPLFESPFGSCKVVVKTIQYLSITEVFMMILIEDIV